MHRALGAGARSQFGSRPRSRFCCASSKMRSSTDAMGRGSSLVVVRQWLCGRCDADERRSIGYRLALDRRVPASVYVIGRKCPTAKPGGRIDKTCRALRSGPREGCCLFLHGNHRPTLPGKPGMPPSQLRERVKWMVREERPHVVRRNAVSLPMGGRRG